MCEFLFSSQVPTQFLVGLHMFSLQRARFTYFLFLPLAEELRDEFDGSEGVANVAAEASSSILTDV